MKRGQLVLLLKGIGLQPNTDQKGQPQMGLGAILMASV